MYYLATSNIIALLISQIHIVTFDGNGKIHQIRQSWDQGSLLKLIDVIGKTGRNWPIRDGGDQIKLIVNSVKSAGKAPVDKKQTLPNRSRENSSNVTRDPHASLSLFAPRGKSTNEPLPAVAAPRASAKPPPRDYHDLFVGNESDNSPVTAAKGINIAGDGMGSRKVTQNYDSPDRPAGIAPKGGSGKNYAPSRLFDHHTEADDVDSPKRSSPDKNHSAEHFYKPNAKKYQHFDFGDGSDAPAPAPTPLKETKSKHGSNWGFDDFNTPAQHVPTKGLRANDIRHWGNSDDEVVDSPIKVRKVDKPRKDNEPHFQFDDEGTPAGKREAGAHPRGAGGNSGMGLYKNNMYDDEQGGEAGGPEQKNVGTLANTKDRRKDFDPHFAMTDDSPAAKPRGPVGEDRAKAVKMMEAQWSAQDESPSQKENKPMPTSPGTIAKGINIAGDGMGSRKAPLSETTNRNGPKGISIGGDGMGGKKGAGRQWGFGDDSDEEDNNKPVYRTGKTAGKNQATGGDFWDF